MSSTSIQKTMTASIFLAFFAPLHVFAQANEDGFASVNNLFLSILNFIEQTLVPMVFALALLTFLYGVFKYFILGGSDEEKRTEGKKLVLYAIVGFVLMSSIYGVVNLIVGAFSLNEVEEGKDTLILPDIPRRETDDV